MTAYIDLKRPAIFAHRGSSTYAPENTLAAFKLAIEHCADGIELDARLSADGHVVVFHDETVERTTDGSGRTGSFKLEELKQLKAGFKFNHSFQSEKIPTLAEVFDALGNQIFINVELKNVASPTDDLPDKVVALVRQYGLEQTVMLSSFNPIALLRLRYLLPDIPLGFLTTRGMASAALHSGLVRFGPKLALHPRFEDVTPELIRAARMANCRIHPYTVKEADQMLKLLSLGVDGIFVDDPLLARSVYAEFTGQATDDCLPGSDKPYPADQSG